MNSVLWFWFVVADCRIIVLHIIFGKQKHNQFKWSLILPQLESQKRLVGSITAMSQIENFIAWKSVSQPIDKHLIKLNFIAPRKGVTKKNDCWLRIRKGGMLYIPESVMIVT